MMTLRQFAAMFTEDSDPIQINVSDGLDIKIYFLDVYYGPNGEPMVFEQGHYNLTHPEMLDCEIASLDNAIGEEFNELVIYLA